jgi:competence protein ComEC
MNMFESKPFIGGTRRPLQWICLCFGLGVVFNEYFRVPWGVFLSLAAVFLLVSVMSRNPKVSTACLLSAVVCGAAAHAGNYTAFPSDHINHVSYFFCQEPLRVEGVVVSDPEPRPFFKGTKTVFSLEVRRVQSTWGWKIKRGIILVNVFRDERIKYGDYVRLEGKLHRPFNFSDDNRFSYREYLYRKGITFILSVKKQGRVEVLQRGQGHPLKDLSFKFKARFSDVLKKNLPKEEAGLMRAFLLGDRYDIPKNVYELFKVSGVAHIIAISGFNIGIVASILFVILKMVPLPRTGQYVLTMGLLVSYCFLTGGQPPVVRATIMAVVFLAGFLVEREHESINTLSAAALILLLMNPMNLFDVGFQLSFVSVLSIIIFYPKCVNLFYKWLPRFKEEAEEGKKGVFLSVKTQIIRYFLQSAAVSITAYMGVGVLVIYYFHLFTPVVIVANLVVVPLASLIMFLGMGLLAVGVVLPSAAFAFANCIIVLLNLMVGSVFFFAQVPGAYFQVEHFPRVIVMIYYGGIILILTGLRWLSQSFPMRINQNLGGDYHLGRIDKGEGL